MPVASLKTASKRADGNKVLDVLGPLVQFLTEVSNNDEDYCLVRGIVPAGVVVPLHSHPERETFYVLEGEVQGLWEDHWITLGAGDVVDVPGGLKHGWRNVSGKSASLLVVVPMRLGRFFRDIVPVAFASQSARDPADFQRLREIAHAYGYWIGSPVDNAAVGIGLAVAP
jgi:quercetin dioxygenase-like cupin family protein